MSVTMQRPRFTKSLRERVRKFIRPLPADAGTTHFVRLKMEGVAIVVSPSSNLCWLATALWQPLQGVESLQSID